MLEWRGGLAAATNRLHGFLAMDDDERGFAVRRVEGRVTWVLDFTEAYEHKMGERPVLDAAVLAAFGFSIPEKPVNLCKGCKQVAKSRGGKCCTAYDNAARTQKAVIVHMQIVD